MGLLAAMIDLIPCFTGTLKVMELLLSLVNIPMADLAKSIKGKMIVSVHNISEMRQAFAGLEMESVSINCTVGGGKRSKAANELIIRNW